MNNFLESVRDGVVITVALVLVGAFKIATAILGILLVAGALLVGLIVSIALIIRDIVISIKGE